MSRGFSQVAYEGLFRISAPFLRRYLQRRAKHGKEITARLNERYGRSNVFRPEGKLVWLHGASVGESLSLLPIVERLRGLPKPPSVLITTGTIGSANVLAQRLPSGCIHQFIPLDNLPWVTRFLDHWQPDGVIWAESDLWPTLLAQIRVRKIPAALLNATMSAKSFNRWLKFPKWARQIADSFMVVTAQTADDAARWRSFGGKAEPQLLGNLKFAAQPLPYDADELNSLRYVVGDRPLWLLASAHPGEELIAGDVHRLLQAEFPRLLTIIVPRHPQRGEEFAARLCDDNFNVARRSQQERIQNETEIYLGDTMGELGLFYRLSRVSVISGSFVPIGGHNPIEPALIGSFPLYGPFMFKQTAICAALEAEKVARPVTDAKNLAIQVRQLLAKPDEAIALGQAAKAVCEQQAQSTVRIWDALSSWRAAAGLA